MDDKDNQNNSSLNESSEFDFQPIPPRGGEGSAAPSMENWS